MQRADCAVHQWLARDLLFPRLMDMGIRNQDQGANERTETTVISFNLYFKLLDFRCARGLQWRIERFAMPVFYAGTLTLPK